MRVGGGFPSNRKSNQERHIDDRFVQVLITYKAKTLNAL